MELVSVRLCNTLMSLLCIAISAVVCTVFAVTSGDNALDTTRDSCGNALTSTRASGKNGQDSIALNGRTSLASLFDFSASTIVKTANRLLKTTGQLTRAKLEVYIERPQQLGRVLGHQMSGLVPDQALIWENFKRNAGTLLYPVVEEHIGKVTLGMMINTKGHMVMYMEDDESIGGYNGTDYHRPIVTFNNQEPFNPDTWHENEEQHCKGANGTLISCTFWADVVGSFGHTTNVGKRTEEQVRTGSWPETGVLGESGTIGYGAACECYEGPMGQGQTGQAPACGRPRSPLWDDPEHSVDDWASGPCAIAMKPLEEPVYQLATLHPAMWLPNMRWTSILQGTGPYLTMLLVGSFAHPDMLSSGYPSTPDGKGGIFGFGLDMRDATKFLERLVVDTMNGTRARVFAVVADDWMAGLAGPDTKGKLVGASHGGGVQLAESWDPYFQKMRVNPQPLPAVESPDYVVNATAWWIATHNGAGGYKPNVAEGLVDASAGFGYAEVYDLTRHGAAQRYAVHTSGESRTAECDQSLERDAGDCELFFILVDHITNEYAINWFTVLTIDRESVLGEIDRANDVLRSDIEAEEERVQLKVQQDTKKTDDRIVQEQAEVQDKLDKDRAILSAVVAVTSVLLCIVSVVFVMAITSPILLLAGQMQQVAMMQLDDIDDGMALSTLAEVKQMQGSFLTMVRNMRELRNYMPQSLLIDDDEEEEGEKDSAADAKPDGPRRNSRDQPFTTLRSGARRKSVDSADSAGAAGKDSGLRRKSRGSTDEGGPSSGRTSMRTAAKADANAYLQKMAGGAVAKKKVTVLACNAAEWHARCKKLKAAELVHVHAEVMNTLIQKVKEAKGVSEAFSGDRLCSTFNAVRPVGTHRVGACTAGYTINEVLAGRATTVKSQASTVKSQLTSEPSGRESLVQMSQAATTGELQCGNMGCVGMKKFTFMGPTVSFVYGLERIGRHIKTSGIAVDAGIAEDAGNVYMLRSLGVVEFAKLPKGSAKVREVLGKKTVSEDEWMYQLEQGQKDSPYSGWDACVASLLEHDFAAAKEEYDRWAAATPPPGGSADVTGGASVWLQNLVTAEQPAVTQLLFH